MAINHVKKYMRGYPIALITDQSNAKLSQVELFNIAEYEKTAINFEKYYTHRSSNSFFFELFCFQRWFILDEFTTAENINGQVLYLDSDVLVYKDLFKLVNLGEKYMTVTKGFGPQYSLFQNRNSISVFCDFIMDYFLVPDKIQYLDNWYINRFLKTGSPGGVCDMTLLGLFNDKDNCNDLFKSESFFNSFFKDLEKDGADLGYDMRTFKSDNFNQKGDEVFISNIPLAALHFQGKSKQIMHQFYLGSGKNRYWVQLEGKRKLEPLYNMFYKFYRRIYLKLKYPKGLPANHNK